MNQLAAISLTPTPCHPERSLAVSKANRKAESKDTYPPTAPGAEVGKSSSITRSGEQETGRKQERSREAAKEFSPRRKPWGSTESSPSPKGAKENTPRTAVKI